ncbi:hypothetical protein QUF61_15375 [Candidatus Venteria ishoeyi]|uniref:hypothetical protein n=1 Tax=Candidatus Venteria ishoeyi TaxID=1899563 RepID=UPI0025A67CB4|nr:hypothetical protein [Candidatus Venteria ishoeyi]MDM8547868.1 hypothetical protein [Candidatus Venteria ishoeyi]
MKTKKIYFPVVMALIATNGFAKEIKIGKYFELYSTLGVMNYTYESATSTSKDNKITDNIPLAGIGGAASIFYDNFGFLGINGRYETTGGGQDNLGNTLVKLERQDWSTALFYKPSTNISILKDLSFSAGYQNGRTNLDHISDLEGRGVNSHFTAKGPFIGLIYGHTFGVSQTNKNGYGKLNISIAAAKLDGEESVYNPVSTFEKIGMGDTLAGKLSLSWSGVFLPKTIKSKSTDPAVAYKISLDAYRYDFNVDKMVEKRNGIIVNPSATGNFGLTETVFSIKFQLSYLF